jgi:hypothetical protein
MTRPVSEPQRVKNHARRSKNQAEAPVTSHEMRSQWILSQVALPLPSSCVSFIYHKPEGVVHKLFKQELTATIYAQSIRSLHFVLVASCTAIGRGGVFTRAGPPCANSNRGGLHPWIAL